MHRPLEWCRASLPYSRPNALTGLAVAGSVERRALPEQSWWRVYFWPRQYISYRLNIRLPYPGIGPYSSDKSVGRLDAGLGNFYESSVRGLAFNGELGCSFKQFGC